MVNEEKERILSVYKDLDSSGISARYDYLNPAYLFHMHEREREILSFLNRKGIGIRGLKVLEVGCGTGHILQRFLEFEAKEVFGIDLIEERIKKGRSKYLNVNLMCGDAQHLPFEEASFDLVTQFMCFSSILNEEMRFNVAKEMWRALKPGGTVLFYEMRPPSAFLKYISGLSRWFYPLRKDRVEFRRKDYIRFLTVDDIRKFFPDGKIEYKIVSLDFSVAERIAKYHFLAEFLSLFSFMKSHNLVIIKKLNNKDL